MALIGQGILGPFSGKVGSVVGCVCTTRRFYIRSLPKHYRDARTAEQLRNREKLKLLMGFLSEAKVFVNRHLDKFAVGQTATNVATSLNFHRAFGESGGLVYGNVMVSKGNVAGLEGLQVLRSGNSVVVCWQVGVMGERCSGVDGVSVMVYNALRGESRVFLDKAVRMDGGLWMDVPESWVGEDVHVYVAVGDRNGVESSDSQYCFLSGGDSEAMMVGEVLDCDEDGLEKRSGEGSIFFGLDSEQSATKEVLDSGEG